MTQQEPQWKDFERIVGDLHAAFNPGAVIKLNDQIMGQNSGTTRQVDVSVRQTIGTEEIFIAVECKDLNRPVDVTEIGAFIAVMDDVQAHCGVVVSRNGFSQAARTLAQRSRINLFTLEDTTKRNWLNGLKMPIVFDLWILNPTFARLRRKDDSIHDFQSDTELTVTDSGSSQVVSLATILRKAWERNSQKAEGNYTNRGEARFETTDVEPSGTLEIGFSAKNCRCLREARLDFLGMVSAKTNVASVAAMRITAQGPPIPFPKGQIFQDTPKGFSGLGLLVTTTEVVTEISKKASMVSLLQNGVFYLEVKFPKGPGKIDLKDVHLGPITEGA